MTFSMTLGLAVTFQNFKTLLILAYFFTLVKQFLQKQTLVFTKVRAVRVV